MARKHVSVAGALLLGASALLASAAQAATITFDSVGDGSTLSFLENVDGATLNTTIGFSLTSLSATSATFAMTVKNFSSGPGQNAFMSFGIDVVSPTLTGASASGIWDAGINAILPGSQRVDLCVYAANNCSGGAISQGLAEGGTSTFSLVLSTSGNFLTNGISFTSPYSAKWQSVGLSGNSYESPNGCFGECSPPPPSSVPEPATLSLLGLGLIAVGLMRRRSRAN